MKDKDKEKKHGGKLPPEVKYLRYSTKKFAEKVSNVSFKGLDKDEKKELRKEVEKEMARSAVIGLNDAVYILIKDPDHPKVDKIRKGIDNILHRPSIMKRVAKYIKKDLKSNDPQYNHMIYLPEFIMQTLLYYSKPDLTEDEKLEAAEYDKSALIELCESILKKPMKKYEENGIDHDMAYQLAVIVPSLKVFNDPKKFRTLLNSLYDIAELTPVDFDKIMMTIPKIDKKGKRALNKEEFMIGFFSEFIFMKVSNRFKMFNEYQKALHEVILSRALDFMNSMNEDDLAKFLKKYIKKRKNAEEHMNDGKRVIKFVDHANSNSPYHTIKKVVTDLIAENSSNEIYLG